MLEHTIGEIALLAVWVAGASILVGILAGQFGIGGGAIIVPVLYEVFRELGVPEELRMQLCIGTSLAIIVPTTVRSYLAHKRRGAVIPLVMRTWTVPAILGVAIGSVAAAYAPAPVFKIAFVIFAAFIATRMLFGGDHWSLGKELPGRAVLTGYGFLYRTRQLLVRQRTMLSNAIRGHLAELGIVSAKGRHGVGELLRIIADGADNRIAPATRAILDVMARQYSAIGIEISSIDKSILAWHRSCEASRRLEEIPGIGPIVATALVAEVGDWQEFRSGRSLAPWIGLVPKQHTTGGRDKLGSISKQGNRYLRWLLVAGAMAVIRYAQKHGTGRRPWLGRLMERRPTLVAAVALANKIARMAWSVMVRGERYKEPKLLPTAA